MDTESIDPDDSVSEVSGIGPARSETLESEGYDTVGDLQTADVSELAMVIPDDVARSVKEQVGDRVDNLPDVSVARKKAQQIPGAKAKVIRDDSGSQRAKVLEKEREEHVAGATIEIHKG